ncbi:aftiphilin isoform X3 [Gymnogyps californianus]|uniref:aftiphilin isoform X3 n=1 Tax=Gymnogyps californianus TaxID=33616 RepID=UPI0021C9341F|nr:aftiphilin isoform X3 [Gymnogyps californianus]
MEPDIIRMYSSSPPPLDNGADDDDEDEFGEFGGFSGVSTAGVAFADFDTPDYGHPKEEFIPTNHFIPLHDYSDNVASIATFTSVKNVKDKDCIAELPTLSKELSDMSATSTSKEKSKFRTSGTALEDVNKRGEQRDNTGKSEGFSSRVIRTGTAVESQDEQIDACNGEKLPCLEILTNGFTASDPVNPQGTEDLDGIGDSKGLKTVSTRSTEQNLNSMPSSGEDFADFAAFSNKKTIHLEGTGPTICSVLNERDSLSIQENNRINRVTHIEEEVCISEISCEQGPSALEDNEFAISSTSRTTGSSICTTENGERSGRRRQHGIENGKDFTRPDDSLGTEDIKADKIQSLSCDLAGEKLGDSEDLKNGGSSTEAVACSDTHDDDFGDFGSVSSASPTFINAQESISALDLEGPSEQPAHINDEFGEFRDTSTVSQQPARLDQAEPNQTADTLECDTTSKTSGLDFQHTTEVENGDDSEFGDFDSVPKPQDESVAFQDSDDFADFSSAGCNQATDWNAFEDEQKDSCSWAAFGDEQAGECHHRKETWQSHRTDASSGIDGPVLHKTDNFALASSQGTTSKQSQEPAPSIQTTLLSRLERIFEVCFPSMPVLEIEEEISSLNHLLEAGEKQMTAEETLANTGELMDVWTELQDIHDAYGLRYQWGGSHSNKKLLCSLGIDTRNILFTGNKKQPVIVPMYAAGLGMLEPTKEPLKPISAAEKIASIGQTPPVSPEMNTCTSDQLQESLPPVQFDWSSSGLTNPLDGVDPELYELTTSKLETSNASNRVTDAFARLMSTVEKASTSTRKPKKEEHLSEEAAKVISSLPDLTFMHAKVLMFPATLTPSTSCQEKVD